MVVLVIGPSGVGKSDYATHAQNVLDGCECVDLDDLVGEAAGVRVYDLLGQVGADAFLGLCRT